MRIPGYIFSGLALSLLTIWLAVVHKNAEGSARRWDLQAFYLGAEMVRHGEGHEIYDLHEQAEAQNRYVDLTKHASLPERPFLYPSAILVLFLPFAWFPMWLAYAFWTAVSLLMLGAALHLLQKALVLNANGWAMMAALFFAPVDVCLMKGQVSILILFLISCGFYFLTRDRPLLAGFLFGLATVKFQVVLGLFAVFLLRRLWRVTAGAALGSLCVFFLSILFSGWRATVFYPKFLLQVVYDHGVAHTDISISLRGMLWSLSHHEAPGWLAAILSIAVVTLAAVVWRDVRTGFSIALIASLLTSYHAHYEELCLLLIPALVLVAKAGWNATLGVILAVVLLGSYLVLLDSLDTPFALAGYILVLFGMYWTQRYTSRARSELPVPQ